MRGEPALPSQEVVLMNSVTHLSRRHIQTAGGPSLYLVHSATPTKTRPQRIAERWLVALMVVCSVLFGAALVSQVFSPAADTLASSASSEGWTSEAH
jgi:hypothetical protein